MKYMLTSVLLSLLLASCEEVPVPTEETLSGENINLANERATQAKHSFMGVADFAKPSRSKMTCEQWFFENAINTQAENVRSLNYEFSTQNTSIPSIANCAYIVKLTRNGIQEQHCESKGWSMASFQGTFEIYDEIIPVHSCVNSQNKDIRIQTMVLREVDKVNPKLANNFVDQASADISQELPKSKAYLGIADLPEPSLSKMTCKIWLAENNISPREDQVRTEEYDFETGNSDIPKIRNCSYIVKLTQNGVQKTFCESKGWDYKSFQGSFDLYDEVIPVHSCITDVQGKKRIQTSVFRTLDGVDEAVANNYITQPESGTNTDDTETTNAEDQELPTLAQYAFAELVDLKAPSKTKLTCKQWLAENNISARSDQVRSHSETKSSGYITIPSPANCAYIVKLTQNGVQKTFCESKGWSMTSFQGTFDLYDEITPVASCDLNNDKIIKTTAYRKIN